MARGTVVDRAVGMWRAAESWAAALTQPRCDIALEDAACAHIFRHSAIGRAASRSRRAVRAAWTGSAVAGIVSRSVPRTSNREFRLRVSSGVTAIASATALALYAVRPSPVGSWSWLLPASCAVVSVAGVALAGPLARLSGERHR